MNRAKDRVVNYAEQRVRWSAQWLAAGRDNQPWKVDMTHVNAHGHSMGGTANNDWGLRMGDIFCITVDSAGATIHSRNKTWVNQASKLWGPVAKDLPLESRRYDYSGGKLTITRTDEGGVWSKYQNYAQWSLDHMARETAWMTISHGKRDGSVVFEPVPDYLDALQRSKRPFAATWNMRGHSWQGYGTRNGSWGKYALKVDETIPAFSNASNNDDPRTTNTGQINGKLEWSSSGNDFDPKSKADDRVDSPKMWAMNLREGAELQDHPGRQVLLGEHQLRRPRQPGEGRLRHSHRRQARPGDRDRIQGQQRGAGEPAGDSPVGRATALLAKTDAKDPSGRA